jgi:hypothetical protein
MHAYHTEYFFIVHSIYFCCIFVVCMTTMCEVYEEKEFYENFQDQTFKADDGSSITHHYEKAEVLWESFKSTLGSKRMMAAVSPTITKRLKYCGSLLRAHLVPVPAPPCISIWPH